MTRREITIPAKWPYPASKHWQYEHSQCQQVIDKLPRTESRRAGQCGREDCRFDAGKGSLVSLALARYRARRYYDWLRERAPEDWEQCVEIGAIDLPEMGREMRALAVALGFRTRYGTQRSERSSTVDIPRKPDTRPSRLARRTGYRKDSAAHRTARLKVNEETRRAIARKGADARWSRR